MYKVKYKSKNAVQAWVTLTSVNSEASALNAAARAAKRYFMVKVEDKKGATVWSK